MYTDQPYGFASPRSEFWAGCRAIVPLIIGAIPFGLIFGTLASSHGLSFWGAIAMSALVFAGSSQFIALTLLAAGTATPLILLTTLVVNLRHFLYAVSLIPHLQNLPQTWKLPLGFWLTDEAFAVAIARYSQTDPSPYKHWYHLGSAMLMYTTWVFCTLLGLTLGKLLPNAARWGLDFAMSATFIGMVIPYLTSQPMLMSVFVAGVMSVLAHGLPHQIGLIIATLSGMVAGMVTESIRPPLSPR